MTTVLKLGGSLITRKDTPETVDERALAAAADAVARAGFAGGEGADDAGADLVIVHGAGSFGHYHADRHGVSTDRGTRDARAIREIHDAMGALNAAVLDALSAVGVPALPVRPLSVARRDEAGDLRMPVGAVAGLLEEGFVPLLHGDVVAHAGRGGTVLSGDELVVHLARALDADRVGLCSTVPGVLDEEGAVVPSIDAVEDAPALGESDATDVTGGMAAKVAVLLDLAAPAHVFGLDDLPAFLAGEPAGTRIGGE